jgi:hypothetical protein
MNTAKSLDAGLQVLDRLNEISAKQPPPVPFAISKLLKPRPQYGLSGDDLIEEQEVGNIIVGRYKSENDTHYICLTPIPLRPRYADDPRDMEIYLPCQNEAAAITVYAIFTGTAILTGMEWRAI